MVVNFTMSKGRCVAYREETGACHKSFCGAG